MRATYVGELDVAVGDAGDLASGAGDGLDAHTVVGVHNLRVGDMDGVNGVVVAAANRADGETVTTRAVAASEGDISTAIDSEAVILVVDSRAGDGDLLGATDVLFRFSVSHAILASRTLDTVSIRRKEGRLTKASVLCNRVVSQCFMLQKVVFQTYSALRVTILVVDSDAVELNVGGAVDGEDLNGRVLDSQSLDDRVRHRVGVEELWLRLSTVRALGVPPTGTVTIWRSQPNVSRTRQACMIGTYREWRRYHRW